MFFSFSMSSFSLPPDSPDGFCSGFGLGCLVAFAGFDVGGGGAG
jgi:hypothetical protein